MSIGIDAPLPRVYSRAMRSFIAYWAASFVAHLVWENAQMPLFEAAGSWRENFAMCLFATATGDMLFMLTLYLTLVVTHRDLCWVGNREAYRHPATWVLPVLVGVLLAVSFELWAVYAVGRWKYGSMPVIPVLGVGLTPALQMIVVPLLTLAFSRRTAAGGGGGADARLRRKKADSAARPRRSPGP